MWKCPTRIRNFDLELEKGNEGRHVHMRILYIEVTFEEI